MQSSVRPPQTRPHSQPGRVALIVNPQARTVISAQMWRSVAEQLQAQATVCEEVETSGDTSSIDRVAGVVREIQPDTVIAAGGDGTVNEVVEGIMRAAVAVPPALAVIPLGTANDFARSFGLRSCRREGQVAVNRAIDTALNGAERCIDLGWVDGRYFVGSFAVGMDADILVMRNRVRQRFGLGRRVGGYPLYLWSCAINLVLRRHGGSARMRIDGAAVTARVYNVLVTNAPLYAGEFRFDAGGHCDDGCLDLHVFSGPLDYVRQFVAAWRRHVHYTRGHRVAVPPGLRRVREVTIELGAPVACQIDGEESVASASYAIRVVPQALAVRRAGGGGPMRPP